MTENTTKRKVGRPSKFDTLTQTHGKVETVKDISQISTLEECMGGINPLSAYGTINETDYAARLRNMNHTELAAHAKEKGIMFTLAAQDPYCRLRDLLLKEFRMYAASLQRPVHPSSNTIVSEQTKKILESKTKDILR